MMRNQLSFVPQVHGAVGAVSAGFYTEVEHTRTRPFRMHAKVFGGRDGQQVGATMHSTSDAQWEAFSGAAEVCTLHDDGL